MGSTVPGDRKKKQWGPIQGTRQSSRVNLNGKTMLELARDLKRRQYLKGTEKLYNKLQGIISQKPFSAHQKTTLLHMANKVGVTAIEDDVVSGKQKVVGSSVSSSRSEHTCSSPIIDLSSSSFFPPLSPNTADHLQDDPKEKYSSGGLWTTVHRHRRGKHSKNKVV